MKLNNFLEVVKKAIIIKAKDGVDRKNINAVILMAFDQLDDTTRVSLLISALNDQDLDDIIKQEKIYETSQELDGINQAELIKWRAWLMRALVVAAIALTSIFTSLMFFTAESCDPTETTSIFTDIRNIIDVIIFNKTE